MNSFWTRIITQTILKNKNQQPFVSRINSSFQLAKAYRELIITIKRQFKDFILITLGIFSAAFGFKGFLLTNHFIDGGQLESHY